jgi:hypothetical protein
LKLLFTVAQLQPTKQSVSQLKYASGQESVLEKAKQAASETYDKLKHKAEDLVS